MKIVRNATEREREGQRGGERERKSPIRLQDVQIPHSAQSRPSPQAVDAVFSLYVLPIVSVWNQQHLFHQ